jgi:hypothetical protein
MGYSVIRRKPESRIFPPKNTQIDTGFRRYDERLEHYDTP